MTASPSVSPPPIRTSRPRWGGAVLVWASTDWVVWVLSYFVALILRYDLQIGPFLTQTNAVVAAVTATSHAALATVAGAYSRVSLRGTFDELRSLVASSAVVSLLLTWWTLVERPGTARSVPVIAALTASTLMLALRFVARSIRELRALTHKERIPVIIFGAGAGGRLLAQNLLGDRNADYRPVAFLDDARAKHLHRVCGVRVRGGRDDLVKVAARTGADHLVIAIPSAPGPVIAELRQLGTEAGLEVLVVPPLNQLVGAGTHAVTGRDLREVHLEDLLGRRPITLDTAVIGEAISHRTVLVTGAGGSIGSELCRQLAKFNPQMLVLLDRDESALQALTIDLYGDGLLERSGIVLADIRDRQALGDAFRRHRPDIVFHAAALKHLPLLETYPVEAWKSNVLGTLNVLEAAAAVGVEAFVNISTDKAADPTSVLGYSKRIAERLTAAYALRGHERYFSVRFGNVLGSRGSVIPAFQEQIRRGGPITVTHPEAERYFMLIPEACQLVMQAAAMGRPGEVMVLDMGQQVRILDVAKTLLSLSGRNDIEIRFTGLRPGEKLSEDLFHLGDAQRATAHPLVSAVDVPPLLEPVRDIEITETTVQHCFETYGRAVKDARDLHPDASRAR